MGMMDQGGEMAEPQQIAEEQAGDEQPLE